MSSILSDDLYNNFKAIEEYNRLKRSKFNTFGTNTESNDFTYSYSDLYSSDCSGESEYQLSTLIEVLKDRIATNDPMLDSVKYPNLLVSTLEELNNLIGMNRLKDSISLQIMRLIDAVNNGEKSNSMLNTILYGPPGVGKTKVGIILAKIWFSLGYLKQEEKSVVNNYATITGNPMTGDDDINPLIPLLLILLFYAGTYVIAGVKYMYSYLGLVWLLVVIGVVLLLCFFFYWNKTTYNWIVNITSEDYNNVEVLENINDRDIITVVSRDDFVGGYSGHTAIKTKKLLTSNLGKVIFIDEAYSLLNDPRDAFGVEALTTLNLFMSEHPNSIAVIFAGYKDLMQQGIFSFQPGLPRRCMWHFECDGYDGKELYKIFCRQVESAGWSIIEDDKKEIKHLIMKYEGLFNSYGGDTERLLFYSQLESSKSVMLNKEKRSIGTSESGTDASDITDVTDADNVDLFGLNKKVLTVKHIKEGIKKLRENNIKN